jgi:hypothetical protein
MNTKTVSGLVLVAGCLLFASARAGPLGWDPGDPEPGRMPPRAETRGDSSEDWSAAWWQWALTIPDGPAHPLYDQTGEHCGVGQHGGVWFLAGTSADEDPDTPTLEVTRACTLPTGKAIFFPIVNIACSTLEAPPFGPLPGEVWGDAELSACAARFIDGPVALVRGLRVSLDDRSLKQLDACRARSPLFRFTLPSPNILGVAVPEAQETVDGQAVSDGYYVMLPPLSAGEHRLEVRGKFVDPDTHELVFGLDVAYDLRVVPPE